MKCVYDLRRHYILIQFAIGGGGGGGENDFRVLLLLEVTLVWRYVKRYGVGKKQTGKEYTLQLKIFQHHYNDVIMGVMAFQITSLTIVYSKVDIKENIKTPRHWPVWGEFTGDRWIPRTKGQ